MGTSTWSGPIRSKNGFQLVSQNATTGAISDVTNLVGTDSRRYALSEYWKKRPALNAVLALPGSDTTGPTAAAFAAYTIANKDFEILGTNMTTALVTFDTTRGGITITTAGADQDQAIIAPHLDTNMSAWQVVKWGTENQLNWECSISTNAIDNQKLWAGLKLTNDQLVATDADQAFFKFQTDDTNSEVFTDYTKLHFIYSVGGTDYISALPITVAADTTYHLKIVINAARKATIYVNGIQYNISNVSGSTGGTAVTAVAPDTAPTLSNALTNDVDLIPYIGIEAGAGAAEALDVHYQAISRTIFE